MELTVYGPLRGVTGDKTVEVEPDGETMRDVVDAFVEAYPQTASQLVDESGEIRPSVRVMVGGDRASLDEPVSAGQSVTLFPAMRGG